MFHLDSIVNRDLGIVLNNPINIVNNMYRVHKPKQKKKYGVPSIKISKVPSPGSGLMK